MERDPAHERRKYRRLRTESVVSIARVDADNEVARTVDLSLGGIRFQCAALELELGEVLRVTLDLGGTHISPVGKLVRVTDLDDLNQEFALDFIEVDAEALELLKTHLDEGPEL